MSNHIITYKHAAEQWPEVSAHKLCFYNPNIGSRSNQEL